MASVGVERKKDSIRITIEVNIKPGSSMLECEESILEGINQAGCLATGECLTRFDTDGSPISVGDINFTSKGQVEKEYQTPYGEVIVSRHVYQSGWGGGTYCPLDRDARIVNSSTPRFAKMAAHKYAVMKSTTAQKDLEENHGRRVSRCYLQDISQEVAQIAEKKLEQWRYEDASTNDYVHTIGLGIDGTCVLFCEEGYRLSMVGTISLYDIMGERLHTVYVGVEPEYGKEEFLKRMENEIKVYKERCPWAKWIGIADGARDNWPWLETHTEVQVLDYYHVLTYLESATAGMCISARNRSQWVEEEEHNLRHQSGYVYQLIARMAKALENQALTRQARADLAKALSYFRSNQERMHYARYRRQKFPIGSGVTEAACKTVVKERMRGSGMKWKKQGASVVLTLRSLILTEGRWSQFWSKVSQFGF